MTEQMRSYWSKILSCQISAHSVDNRLIVQQGVLAMLSTFFAQTKMPMFCQLLFILLDLTCKICTFPHMPRNCKTCIETGASAFGMFPVPVSKLEIFCHSSELCECLDQTIQFLYIFETGSDSCKNVPGSRESSEIICFIFLQPLPSSSNFRHLCIRSSFRVSDIIRCQTFGLPFSKLFPQNQ